jgi:SAM-dependent methyltransferase
VNNYEAILYDGYKIPFAEETFDAAISRNGIMFSPDLNKAMSEVSRVLKPKGRVVISGWGPPENNETGYIIRNILSDLVNLTPVQVGEPGPYKFAVKGFLTGLLSDSQLEEIREVDVYGTVKFDSPFHFWKFISESQMPVIEAIAKYGSECEKKIKTTVFDAVTPYKKNKGPGIPVARCCWLWSKEIRIIFISSKKCQYHKN